MHSPISKVTVKYQTSIPKEIRDKLHIKAGDFVEFEVEGNEVKIKKAKAVMDKNTLKLMEMSLQEWNSKEDDEQFGYLEKLVK